MQELQEVHLQGAAHVRPGVLLHVVQEAQQGQAVKENGQIQVKDCCITAISV